MNQLILIGLPSIYIYKKTVKKINKEPARFMDTQKTAVKNGGWVEEQCSCKRVLYMTV